jgi:glycosyltransferase involved in cell wall biosynthesis
MAMTLCSDLRYSGLSRTEVNTSHLGSQADIAVLIPCYNEELTVGEVIRQFQNHLPQSIVYVFDNNSTDRTIERATAAGATVYRESKQGKGNVIQAMFNQIEAEIYVLIDGDGTYLPADVHGLISPLQKGDAEMVVGVRWKKGARHEFFRFLGNILFLVLVNLIYRMRLRDVLSGYRAFNKKFVQEIQLTGGGFETEIEMTIKALQKRLRIIEIPVGFIQRPLGSFSKINIIRDGLAILTMILRLLIWKEKVATSSSYLDNRL